MSLKPSKDDPNYESEMMRRAREPGRFGDLKAQDLLDAAVLSKGESVAFKEAEDKAKAEIKKDKGK